MTAHAAQLEAAAQWLREGAIALRGAEPAETMYRVADECERAAGVPSRFEKWLQERKAK